jgi:hypothetical protein
MTLLVRVALGLDDLAEWVLRGLVAFVVVGVVVALIVVQTVVIVLTGATTAPSAETDPKVTGEVTAPNAILFDVNRFFRSS